MNHVMLDCYQGNERRLNDIRSINNVLNEIVDSLNLETVMPPFLLPYYYAEDPDDDGISAFVLLKGGHITIHTFPFRGCMFVDLLYDGYFDVKKLQNILMGNFLYVKECCIRTERRFYDASIEQKSEDDEKISNRDFGPHIIAKVENLENLTLEEIYDILDEMPSRINMKAICRPYVLKSNLGAARYLSGIVLIAQSHIAFHYDRVDKTLFCDLFSCSFYKSENFINYLKEKFEIKEYMTLIRGSKHQYNIKDRGAERRSLGKWLDNMEKDDIDDDV